MKNFFKEHLQYKDWQFYFISGEDHDEDKGKKEKSPCKNIRGI